MADHNAAKRIGLVAGWGRYPIVVAEALKRQGYEVYCLGYRDHADTALLSICDDFRWTGIAKLGGQIRHFRRNGIRRAVMAGKIFKDKLLYHGIGWVRHLPDWRCFRVAFPFFASKTKDKKDDTFLMAFVREYAKDQITFEPATDFAPELLVKQGTLSRRRPSGSEWKDVQFGWQIAKQLGRVDVGQSVVVKGQAVIAVEAIEGTDSCIRRAGDLCPQGGFSVIKVAKPQQDMRFDVPTIGVGTLRTLIEAGGRVLAIEANKTIILDESDVIEFADRHRLTIVAVEESQLAGQSDAA